MKKICLFICFFLLFVMNNCHAASLIAAASGGVTSSAFTLREGHVRSAAFSSNGKLPYVDCVTIMMFNSASSSDVVDLEIYEADGTWEDAYDGSTQVQLSYQIQTGYAICSPGTYRVVKPAGANNNLTVELLR